ncbi:MAG: beta-galactosidase [Clostridia bacterium]|nr:beta-galactosidase [Clostridia bacterium]
MRKKLTADRLTLGVCYYPEHWDPSLWREDLRRMKEMGISVIRIAEFAWNKFEPEEGIFTFEFFDSFMEIVKEEGMRVIFCTPTATPPAWMSHKYPEILNADLNGNLIRHGHRRHYNMTSDAYRAFVARITEKLGEHYGKHPNIVAWQLDNEINCECHLYYSESDHKAFRDYLRKQFKTLDALNDAIGAVFWNQTYTDWEEVYLTRPTLHKGHTNPHMELLERRFISDTVIDFFKLQTDILRKYTDAKITTNGLFRYIDYHRLTDEVLDFITLDNYPHFNEKRDELNNVEQRRKATYRLARTRSISPIFGIMEQQSGVGGWTFWHPTEAPKPGYLRLWALQSIANGADFVSFFRYRTCSFGTEIYWHGILNYDNRDNRRVEEVKKLWRDLQKIEQIAGKPFKAELAILRDYDNELDGENDLWHGDADGISYPAWVSAAEKAHIPFDLVYINDDTNPAELSNYKMVVYPHAAILTEKRAGMLRSYAEAGGTVLFGCRTGYKDLYGRCPMMPMPGYAAELCGITVDDFTAVSNEGDGAWVELDGQRISAPVFNDILTPIDADTVATFDNRYYKGACALSEKKVGKGKALYFGGAFGEDTARAILKRESIEAPDQWSRILSLPETVGLTVRGEYAFLLNYSEQAVEIPCTEPLFSLFEETTVTETLLLAPLDVAVLKRKNP